ncbi:hypothetical protein CJ469_02588 [Nocardia farcinica]|nr:hypothetical protein CJ469_02588 [Nocardia farcinica]SLH58230.1 Uncharacterised protein [Mycobacteroides abscessus subsp. abscessus]
MNSVGPYRLTTVAGLSLRNSATVEEVNASPPTKIARSELHSAAGAVEANTDSSDGTNEVMVTWCRQITSDW